VERAGPRWAAEVVRGVTAEVVQEGPWSVANPWGCSTVVVF
jgi:hypothetical protein